MLFDKLKKIIMHKRNYCEINIDKKQLKELIEKGAILVDVRSKQEYNEGHLENAILLPFYEIKQIASSILQDKDRIIVVYCNTGHRSKKAQKMLRQMGYNQVYNLCKGIF